MNDDARDARKLLAPLRERPASVDAERLGARRERVLSAISSEVNTLAARRKQRRWWRAAGAASLLAAGVACAFWAPRLLQRPAPATLALTFVGSVGQTHAGSARTLRAGEALAADPGEISTAAEGSAELISSAGLGLRLGGATRLSLAALLGPGAQNQVALRQGEVTCSVPHLQEGQRFSVQTPDARVVVHGTVFSVNVDTTRPAGHATCVAVTEGVVIVQHAGSETALNAGDSWGCEPEARADAAPAPAVDSEPPPIRALIKPSPRAIERGTLARESELLQRALAAERQGQREQAATLLAQLLTKYPSSPLVPEARRALGRVKSSP